MTLLRQAPVLVLALAIAVVLAGCSGAKKSATPALSASPTRRPVATATRAATRPTGPASGRIVFSSEFGVDAIDADGSNYLDLTHSRDNNGHPAWSPDGTRIVFDSGRDGPREIYAMNADGSGQTNLTNNPADDSSPAWSPDGTRIAFNSDRDGPREIYVMNTDGSGQTNLTNNPADDTDAAWSPDGSRIAFVSDRDDEHHGSQTSVNDIYVMNVDGANLVNLTNDSANDYDPDWSPDGARIAFASDRDGLVGEIYVMNADGSDPVLIRPLPHDLAPVPGLLGGSVPARGDGEPVWSPDGTRIAFTSHFIGHFDSDIYIINADGSGMVKLTNNGDGYASPAWSPSP